MVAAVTAGGAGRRQRGRVPRPAPGGSALLVAVAAIALGGVLVVTQRPTGTSSPSTAAPESGSPAASPTPRSTADPAHPVVFEGDATGSTDVTEELRAFLESHDGERVALAENGLYLVTSVSFTAHDLTVDFRGSQLRGTQRGAHGILVLRSGSNVVLNEPSIVGTGYAWEGGDANPDQWEHGIEIDSGSDITINGPTTRDVRGDGIYIGFVAGENTPATGVVINDPDLQRSSRNGIAPVAGEVTVIGGRIHDSGLHGVDFEPNNDEGAGSIVGVVRGVDIRRAGGLDVHGLRGYAIAGAGFSTATKPSLVIEDLTGDELDIALYDTASVVVRRNVSDLETTARFFDCGAVDFANNTRITRR